MAIVPVPGDLSEDTTHHADVSTLPRPQGQSRPQSSYIRTYPTAPGMSDMMGGMRLDLPNISTGLVQSDFANQPPHPQHHMQQPPGEPSPQGPNPEAEVTRIYGLLNELLEQLNANRQASIQLHSLAAGVKSQSIHSQTGYVLRRFNLDKTQEEYNAALERMNAQIFTENNALLNDNKQLGVLIKEYEQTLENVMTSFRVRANEVQQRELSIVRDYERKLLAVETAQLEASLSHQTSYSSSLGRAGELLRVLMRALGGEDPSSVPKSVLANIVEAETGSASTGTGTGREGEIDITSTAGHMTIGRQYQKRIINSLELESLPSSAPVSSDLPESSSAVSLSSEASSSSSDASPPGEEAQNEIDVFIDKEAQLIVADWALERECELARLERENAMLRQLLQEREKLDLVTATSGANVHLPGEENAPRLELPRLTTLPKRVPKGRLGGRDIGPYGMYKKYEE